MSSKMGSTANTSDETFDFICSPCGKSGKTREAQKLCSDCNEYLCGNCVDSHDSFAALAGHKLLGKSQFGNKIRAGHGDLPSVPTETCNEHTMKLVDMYCVGHDSVGCNDCFAINHRQCKDVHYIPDYVQQNPNILNAKGGTSDLDHVISKLEDTINKRQKVMNDTNTVRSSYLAKIQNFRADINKELDRLERAFLEDLDEEHNQVASNLHGGLKPMQEMLDKLRKCKDRISQSQNNLSQQFVISKIRQEACLEAGVILAATQLGNLKFSVNTELLRFLQNLQSLGEVQRPKSQKPDLYKVVSMKEYSINQDTDTKEGDILAVYVLDGGDIVLADNKNCSIMLVDGKTHTLKKSLNLASAPLSLCRTSSTEIAVGLKNHSVQFVSTDSGLVPTNLISFDHECSVVAQFGRRKLVVGDSRRIYVYTVNGQLTKTIGKDKDGAGIFIDINAMCASDDGKMLHVADGDNGVITIDADGNVVWKYSGPELKYACGVCTDGAGNVFVIGYNSHNVVQMKEDGTYLGEITTESQCLEYPIAMSFDSINTKLIVALEYSNDVQVLQLK